MNCEKMGVLVFEEQYLERIWGGQRLRTLYGKPIAADKPIGEAWLISDHPSAESVVGQGPLAGKTLHRLLQEDRLGILGTRPMLTVHGRFPLLLKLIHAREILSVQVHPDDETAQQLGESDSGKTEMWHVLDAEPGSELICGLDPNAAPSDVRSAAETVSLERLLVRVPAKWGDSVIVPAGTVHAIGGGILLAEIQQSSDLTYRLYDWGRLQADGTPRELHLEKALAAIHLGSPPGGKTKPLSYANGPAQRTVLAACRHFAAELIELEGLPWTRHTGNESFHILLSKTGSFTIHIFGHEHFVGSGRAVLIPGTVPEFLLEGKGSLLDYYVPNLHRDIIEPLLARGHSREDVLQLGGHPTRTDLRPFL